MYVYEYFLGNPSLVYPDTFFHRAFQACYVIVIVYALTPVIFSSERFSKNNYESIAYEFEFIKKSLFIGLPILVIIVIVSLLLTYFRITPAPSLYDVMLAILAASVATVTGSFLRIVAYTARREFRFYLARGYCNISSGRQNNFDKIKYLFLSLDSYNKYLIRKTTFGIKDIDKICSDIMHTDATENDKLIKSINEHLARQARDLSIYLSTIYRVADTEQFFAKEALVQKLKTVAAFLAAAVPIAISIFQLITGGRGT